MVFLENGGVDGMCLEQYVLYIGICVVWNNFYLNNVV